MGRRRRRQEGDWTSLAWMGLTALLGLFRGRRPDLDAKDLVAPFKPLLTVIALVGAFIGLGVLLTVLSAIAALGGGGALGVLCGMPILFIAFIVWLLSQRPRRMPVSAESDPRTYEGAARPVEAGSPVAADDAVAGPAVLLGRWRPAGTQEAAPRHEPQRRGQTPGTQPIPERPARSPAEYRQRAVSYRRRIQSLIKMRRPGPIAQRMTGVLDKLKSWEERVGQLADRLTLYEKDDLIQRDVREVPGHIERLRRQASLEADPEMQRQVQRTLAAYEEQQRQLDLLARVMKRTRLNLDDTLAAMGTVYSQLQVLNAMDLDGPTAARIAGDVDREVERLNDLLAAMSDVYSVSSEQPRQAGTEVQPSDDTGLSSRKARLGDSAAG